MSWWEVEKSKHQFFIFLHFYQILPICSPVIGIGGGVSGGKGQDCCPRPWEWWQQPLGQQEQLLKMFSLFNANCRASSARGRCMRLQRIWDGFHSGQNAVRRQGDSMTVCLNDSLRTGDDRKMELSDQWSSSFCVTQGRMFGVGL